MYDTENMLSLDIAVPLYKEGKTGLTVWFNCEDHVDLEMPVTEGNIESIKKLIFNLNPKLSISCEYDQSYGIETIEQ